MHHLPEDFNFLQHSCENLKYHKTHNISFMTLKRLSVLMEEEEESEIVRIIVKKGILS
jgi:hypothetical protein